MLNARYHNLAVDVQIRYVRCKISDSSCRCAQVILGARYQALAVDGLQVMLGARYNTLAVDVQHRYVICTLSDTSNGCAAVSVRCNLSETSSRCAAPVYKLHAIRNYQ
jgi:hypothetical protein